ncbi:hypothetical protein OUZ56_030438 [Daphnia magna]|uniref:Chitin-binding type-2 domain-containing protein n=1 Tax=Daphnia magna TaxID=35525 RepID=A0ABQ9ZS73_9CRUS|nr:hypothetical protein OUZ56_030438 [Daphnia magna]
MVYFKVTCTSEGTYYADPANCTKYYRCVNGKIITYYCPASLAFNSYISQCDWPYNKHIKLEYVELNNESITSHKSVLQTIQASVIVTEEPEKLPVSGGKTDCQGSLELWDTSTAFNSQGDTLKGSSELGAPTDDWTTATKESNSACNLTISPAIDCDD